MPFSRLKDLKKLVEFEKQEELKFFQDEVLNTPIKERIENGFTWYPLEVIKSGYTYGDRAFVIVQRNQEGPHKLRAGKIVGFSTLAAGVTNPSYSGTIHYVNNQKMKIILHTKDLPDWLSFGQIAVDLLFDERTYVEMQFALDMVIKASNDRLGEIKNVVFGKTDAYFEKLNPIQVASLNNSQNLAIQNILAARDIAIIHGPPGTGKTTTLVKAIQLTIETEQQVLVCAPSNTAVDLLTIKLSEIGLNVVRLGNISRLDKSIIDMSLDGRLSNHPESKNIKKIKIKAAQARRKAQKYKRNFGKSEYNARKEAYQEARELEAWANDLETKIIGQILDGADVITCTLVGSASKILKKYHFKTVFIDEAAQALEPATWIPILKADKVVLAGDPFQLPPTVKSYQANKQGFSITLMERLLSKLPNINLLTTQYRMHDVIMGFSNQYFYQNELEADISVQNHHLSIGEHHSLEFIDTAGCDFEEIYDEKYKSRSNPDEQMILFEHLYQLLDQFDVQELPSIGIISPYQEQVITIKKAFKQDEKLKDLPFSIATIDSFQGQEKDVIYISLVRSNPKGEIGFLKDYRRMNVAMTRAKKLLIVIGDSSTIGNDKFYSALLDYVDKEGIYRTAWEFMA